MSEKLKVLLVDDEPIASKGLAKYVQDINYLELIAICENALDANDVLNTHEIDLMFLDIQMPKITGIQFLKTLTKKPLTIITSAYSEYALEGYELDVIDYLVKPISFERFLKAVNKAKDYKLNQNSIANNISSKNDFMFVKCEKKIEKIFYSDIEYIESLHNYIAIHTDKEKYVTYLTLKSIESSLPTDLFIKVQKSFIVSIDKIIGMEDGDVILKNIRIPISRANKDSIMQTILGNKYLRR